MIYKKKIAITALALIVGVSSFSTFSNANPNSVSTVSAKTIQATEMEKVNSMLNQALVQNKRTSVNKHFSKKMVKKWDFDNNLDFGSYGTKEEKEYKAYIKKYSKNVSYKIKKTKNKSKIKTEIQYVDLSGPMNYAMEKSFEKSRKDFMNNKNPSDKEMSKYFYASANKKLKVYKPKVKKLTTQITVKKENGKYVITNISDNLGNIITFDMLD